MSDDRELKPRLLQLVRDMADELRLHAAQASRRDPPSATQLRAMIEQSKTAARRSPARRQAADAAGVRDVLNANILAAAGSQDTRCFPSWLEHSVDANPNEAERISLSVNVMLSSFTERLSAPLWGEEE